MKKRALYEQPQGSWVLRGSKRGDGSTRQPVRGLSEKTIDMHDLDDIGSEDDEHVVGPSQRGLPCCGSAGLHGAYQVASPGAVVWQQEGLVFMPFNLKFSRLTVPSSILLYSKKPQKGSLRQFTFSGDIGGTSRRFSHLYTFEDAEYYRWKVKTGSQQVFRDHAANITCMSVHENIHHVVVATADQEGVLVVTDGLAAKVIAKTTLGRDDGESEEVNEAEYYDDEAPLPPAIHHAPLRALSILITWVGSLARGHALVWVGLSDSSVRVLRVHRHMKSLERIARLRAHQDWVTHIVPGPGRVYSASEAGCVLEWRVSEFPATRSPAKRYKPSNSFHPQGFATSGAAVACDAVTALVWARGRLVVGYASGCVRVWLTARSASPVPLPLHGHADQVHKLLVIPGRGWGGGGDRVVSASHDRTVRVWSLRDGSCEQIISGHEGMLDAIAYAGHRVFTSSITDMSVRVWDLRKVHAGKSRLGRSWRSKGSIVSPTSVDADSTPLCPCEYTLGPSDYLVQVVIFQNQLQSKSMHGSGRKVFNLKSGATSHDYLKAINNEGVTQIKTLYVGDLHRCVGYTDRQGDQRLALAQEGNLNTSVSLLSGHSAGINALATHENKVYTASSDHTCRVWDMGTGACEAVLHGHKSAVNAVAVARRGDELFTASADRSVIIWDRVRHVQVFHLIELHAGHICGMQLTKHGDAITVCEAGEMVMWSRAGEVLSRFVDTGRGLTSAHSASVENHAITLEGDKVVSGSWDGIAKLWDIESGALLHSWEGHYSYVSAVCVAPGLAITGDRHGCLRLCSLTTGELLHTVKVHTHRVCDIVYSPLHPDVIFSASSDSTAVQLSVHDGTIVNRYGKQRPAHAPVAKKRTPGWHREGLAKAAVDAEGRLVTACYDGYVLLWDVPATTQECVPSVVPDDHHAAYVTCIGLADNGKLITGATDSVCRVWSCKDAGDDGRKHMSCLTLGGIVYKMHNKIGVLNEDKAKSLPLRMYTSIANSVVFWSIVDNTWRQDCAITPGSGVNYLCSDRVNGYLYVASGDMVYTLSQDPPYQSLQEPVKCNDELVTLDARKGVVVATADDRTIHVWKAGGPMFMILAPFSDVMQPATDAVLSENAEWLVTIETGSYYMHAFHLQWDGNTLLSCHGPAQGNKVAPYRLSSKLRSVIVGVGRRRLSKNPQSLHRRWTRVGDKPTYKQGIELRSDDRAVYVYATNDVFVVNSIALQRFHVLAVRRVVLDNLLRIPSPSEIAQAVKQHDEEEARKRRTHFAVEQGDLYGDYSGNSTLTESPSVQAIQERRKSSRARRSVQRHADEETKVLPTQSARHTSIFGSLALAKQQSKRVRKRQPMSRRYMALACSRKSKKFGTTILVPNSNQKRLHGGLQVALDASAANQAPITFVMGIALILLEFVQLSSYAITSAASLVPSREFKDTWRMTEALGIPTPTLEVALLIVGSMVMLFILAMVLQERLELSALRHESMAAVLMWVGLQLFSQMFSRPLFVPVMKQMVRVGDCTYNSDTGTLVLDADGGATQCFVGLHLFEFVAVTALAVPYAVLAMRLARVGGNLQGVEISSYRRIFNTVEDERTVLPPHGFSASLAPYQARYIVAYIFVKVVAVAAGVIMGRRPGVVIMVMSACSAFLWVLSSLYPPFHGPWANRFRRSVDAALTAVYFGTLVVIRDQLFTSLGSLEATTQSAEVQSERRSSAAWLLLVSVVFALLGWFQDEFTRFCRKVCFKR